jgi:hypothetical protein
VSDISREARSACRRSPVFKAAARGRCPGRWRSRRVAEALAHPLAYVVVVLLGQVCRAVDAADEGQQPLSDRLRLG